MAFDQATRNRLQRFVNDARSALEEEFTRQLQNDYGMDPVSGTVSPLENLRHINDRQRETARILRDTLAHYCANADTDEKAGLDRIVREQAFTVLNRLAALRMAEARGLLIESVRNGYQAQGFQLYTRLAGSGLGETGDAYRTYLHSVFDELAQDLPSLFDRFSPQGRLFPREAALIQVLGLINHGEIEPLWAEDETIGWIYQYFNSKEERKAMRDASQAPRNSRELAVRNQFFTPRYVVEFLVDNTLGRLWFNWTGGQTVLHDRCQYLLVKPDEKPEAADRLRDPRTIKLLDPACGSMHFGLYAFDLYLEIYREAWDWEQANGPGCLDIETGGRLDLEPLSQTYADQDAYLHDVPRLIIEHNIYGVDIDPRAAQIASLALWLRAQRAWHDVGVAAKDRPQVGRGHVAAAVAPPAELDLRKRFMESLEPMDAELFEKTLFMLKGLPELGVLLQVEKELPALVRQVFGEHGDLFSEDDLIRWQEAETRLQEALIEFAQTARSTYQGRLFAEDALQGFRMIDHCREVFDVVVMNPPFGDVSSGSKSYIFRTFPVSKADVYAVFVERGLQLLRSGGQLGAITSRTGFYLTSLRKWRELLIKASPITSFVDLGLGVLDSAMVEASCFTASKQETPVNAAFINCIKASEKDQDLAESIIEGRIKWLDVKKFDAIPDSPFSYWAPPELVDLFASNAPFSASGFRVRQGLGSSDNFRFLRLWWEVNPETIGLNLRWSPYAKGGGYRPHWGDQELLVLWQDDGREIKEFSASLYGSWSKQITNVDFYGRPGLTYSSRTSSDFAPRIFFEGSAFDTKGSCIFDIDGPDKPERLAKALVVLQSPTFRNLLNLCVATSGDTARSYTEALVEKMPTPNIDMIPDHTIAMLMGIVESVKEFARLSEISQCFDGSIVGNGAAELVLNELKSKSKSAQEKYHKTVREMDKIVASAYGIGAAAIEFDQATSSHPFVALENIPTDTEQLVERRISWAVGVAFGRFSQETPSKPSTSNSSINAFKSPPLVSLAVAKDRDESSPNQKSILVDDQGHPLDIIRCVEEIFENKRIDEPNALRDWVRRSFFAKHITTYSESRRKAPIYWPLSTISGGYTLWLYYPSLTGQTLYTAVNDFIEPKLKQVSRDVTGLRTKANARTQSDEKRFEALLILELELIELRDTLLQIAPNYRPNHDDGVQINAAPLWQLFRHKPWQKILKDTWAKLEKGDYDWAHLAMAYWPDRVREKCKTDKSLAIAHDLEELYVEPEIKKKKGRGAK